MSTPNDPTPQDQTGADPQSPAETDAAAAPEAQQPDSLADQAAAWATPASAATPEPAPEAPQYPASSAPQYPEAPAYPASAPSAPEAPQYPSAPQYAPAPPYGSAPAAPYGAQPPAAQTTNTMAIIALVTSFFISLVGVILGHIALSQIKKSGESGRGLAIAALIIGYIGLAAGIILFIVWISVIGWAISSGY